MTGKFSKTWKNDLKWSKPWKYDRKMTLKLPKLSKTYKQQKNDEKCTIK